MYKYIDTNIIFAGREGDIGLLITLIPQDFSLLYLIFGKSKTLGINIELTNAG